MKLDLLYLIEQIDEVEAHFHVVDSIYCTKIKKIQDRPQFSKWKQALLFELNEIYDRTRDNYIANTLSILNTGFKGSRDEQSFNELTGSLLAIKKNINKYYPTESKSTVNDNDKTKEVIKSPKIFISHSSYDADYVSNIVELLEDLGIRENQLFCSSIPGYGIPLDEDIYDYLKKQFQKHDLHIIFILSDNYYKSPACLNEMGAAWILQNRYTTILLPGFDFKEMKGAINPTKIGIKLDGGSLDIKEKLGQLKDSVVKEFSLASISNIRWEKKRNDFIDKINMHKETNQQISDEAIELLSFACDHNDYIIKTVDLSGVDIEISGKHFITLQVAEEVARWENAISELLSAHLIKCRDTKGEVFAVLKSGYEFYERLEFENSDKNSR